MANQNLIAPIGGIADTAINAQATAAPAPAMAPIPTPAGSQAAVTAPVTGTSPGFFQEGGMAQVGLGAIQTLGSLWNSFQKQKLAKQSLAFQKDAYNTNMANQKQTYNTALEDRIRARYATEGRSQEADAKIAANSL